MIGRVAGTTSYGGKDISLDELIDPYDTRETLKYTEITKQTRGDEYKCVFFQCRNSSTTELGLLRPRFMEEKLTREGGSPSST